VSQLSISGNDGGAAVTAADPGTSIRLSGQGLAIGNEEIIRAAAGKKPLEAAAGGRVRRLAAMDGTGKCSLGWVMLSHSNMTLGRWSIATVGHIMKSTRVQ
jgi:hypothetical protein